jgi:ubiquinone/menaquinone biosynthesis C-methylase UbiE
VARSEFAGTEGTRPYREAAHLYAQYRASLSDTFVALLVMAMGWTKADRLLDLGAGPAQIARRLAPHVAEVVAVDPEPEMLAAGRRAAAAEGVANIVFVEASSDDLTPLGSPTGQFHAVTIGSAFHWMRDQDRVLRDLDAFLDPVRGAVLITAYDIEHTTWREREPWSQVKAVLDGYLASTPPRPHPAGRHDPFPEIFERSAFSNLEFLRWEFERESQPSVDAAIEYEYTISHVLPRLGDRRAAFEAEVHALLQDADTSPVCDCVVESALIARRA